MEWVFIAMYVERAANTNVISYGYAKNCVMELYPTMLVCIIIHTM